MSLSTYYLEYGNHLARLHRRRRRRRAHAPTSNTASHDNHEKIGTREKRSAHACLPCFRRELAIEIIRELDSGREIQKSKLHTQKISLEFHEHKVY